MVLEVYAKSFLCQTIIWVMVGWDVGVWQQWMPKLHGQSLCQRLLSPDSTLEFLVIAEQLMLQLEVSFLIKTREFYYNSFNFLKLHSGNLFNSFCRGNSEFCCVTL